MGSLLVEGKGWLTRTLRRMPRPAAIVAQPAKGTHLGPPMSALPTDRYRRVDAVFDALLDIPPGEQMAFAERAAGDDPEIHAEVLRLLHAHRREGFLESPLPMAGAEALLDAAQLPELRQPE